MYDTFSRKGHTNQKKVKSLESTVLIHERKIKSVFGIPMDRTQKMHWTFLVGN